MTVILTQIQAATVIDATDSLLTKELKGVRFRAAGSGLPKVIECARFHGAISWWGRVTAGETWNAASWLADCLKRLESEDITADIFATNLADELQCELRESHIPEEKVINDN